MNALYDWLRPALFMLNPERAHDWTLRALHLAPTQFFQENLNHSPIYAMGLTFPHPVGLAAGLDKDGMHLDALSKLPFSYIEVGTVTPKPQIGNPKPRLFRLKKSEALINRMGFNNRGVDALVLRLQKTHYQGILGINIGKNKDTPLERAVDDYVYCMNKVYPYASYITVNISSPNTPDLRQLQQPDFFSDLLKQLRQTQLKLRDLYQRHVPLVVKISPDETPDTLKQMAAIILEQGIEGIIATNTTCSRVGVEGEAEKNETGGLSGKPLFAASTATLRLIKQEVGDAVTLIGVGGIDSGSAAFEKIQAGASLLQVYSGLIYKGPRLIEDIVSTLQGEEVCSI
jgi:dihydroorotate dehydrogenase